MEITKDIPRRIRVDLFTPAEKAIYDAIQEVEKLPADIQLTDAINLLQNAKDKVSDYIDIPCLHEYKCTLDTDEWSSYTCVKCKHTKIVDF